MYSVTAALNLRWCSSTLATGAWGGSARLCCSSKASAAVARASSRRASVTSSAQVYGRSCTFARYQS